MKIVDFSIRRPVTISMIFLATVVFGVVALGRLDLRLLPEISYPTLTIQTEYPDAAPMEVENFVTRPLEEAVGVVSGLRSLRSASRPGLSEITLEFSWKTQMQYVALDVRDKIDLIQLPRECKAPVILRYDPALDPVMRIGVSGTENLVRLRQVADRTIKKDLESLDGVASARVLGGLEEEIQVELDERKLATFGIPISLISSRLEQENVNQSSGRLRDKGAEFLLRTENEFSGVDEIASTIVRDDRGRQVVLSDLGSVTRGYVERDVITRYNGLEVVEVAVYKEGDANTVEVADAVKNRVEGLRNQLTDEVRADVLFDQSRFIRSAISEVRSNAILGAILSVLILFAFLRDGRSTFIIGLSIPISIMFTFVMMSQLGVSLNLMSLGGLALGVGMLVDNSIVVLESISRHQEAGLARGEATLRGASQVGRAVIASTLTTVAVFLPIVFVEGVAGQVFKDQALTVSVSLMASLIVALMLIPMMSALDVSVSAPGSGAAANGKGRRAPRWLAATGRFLFATGPLFLFRFARLVAFGVGRLTGVILHPMVWLFNGLYSRAERVYPSLLDTVMARRTAFVVGSLLLFAVSLWSSRFIGRSLIPDFSQGEFSFSVELPQGSPLEATDQRVARMEEIAATDPRISNYYASVGLSTRSGSNTKTQDKHIGQLSIVMKDHGDRKAEDRLVADLRRQFNAIDGITCNFSRPSFFTFQTPVELHVFGFELDKLKTFADSLAGEIAAVDGVKDVKTSLEYGNPEVAVEFDRVRLSSLGLSLNDVSNTIKAKIKGEVPTRLKERERQVDIRVRTSAWRSTDIDHMNSLAVGERDGAPILLSTVASVGTSRGLNQITRVSQQRAAVISANIAGRDLGAVSGDIHKILGELGTPVGITVELGGQNEELLHSYRNLRLALLLAVFLVYLVMAAQFESFLHPLIIMFTMPLGAIGVVLTLLVTGKPFSVVVFIGAIMLAGIVVNNGIVLIDYINTLRASGVKRLEAIREAARVRLRPIMMTTLTTVLGLLPMALGFGEGAEIRAPMALTVIGGLLGGTALTLLFVPSLYAMVTRGE